jgi:hypothetical protein
MPPLRPRPRLLAAAAALLLAAAPAAAQGVWRFEFPPVKDPLHAQFREALRTDGSLGDMALSLNESLPLQRDVVIEVAECGARRSYYTPTRPAVRLCYEFMLHLGEMLEAAGPEDANALGDAIGFILLHGISRAFLDQLAVPASLPPHLAADELAAYTLAMSEEERAAAFPALAMLQARELDWEGGAPFTRARGENVICLLYGADPRAHGWVVAEGLLPATRAAGCADEFRDVSEYWELTIGELLEG